MNYFTIFPTAIGPCGIAWREELVVATNLPEGTPQATAVRLAERAMATRAEPPRTIRGAVASISALLEGATIDLDSIDCDFSGIEPLAASIYAATRTIPVGQTCTYGEIAERLGDKQLARQVGGALGRNPLPIVVPCHRVLGANGGLTGFSAFGGVETKRRMLEIEGAVRQQSLFD
ncbi:MAG: methylated-DNA--[protein]-cysteine S-methyltransferase [Pseudomonadota bacterium]